MKTQFEREVAQKLCEVQEQAIIELIWLTGFNVHAYNLKGVEGARHTIERIKEEGYTITQTGTASPIEISYILQRHGKIIAQRDVSVKIEINKQAEEGDIK